MMAGPEPVISEDFGPMTVHLIEAHAMDGFEWGARLDTSDC